jgi:site-specific recombinase XerD
MATVLEDYFQKLKQDDLNSSTAAKYRQILVSYSNWLSGSKPNIANAKEFIAHLRDRGYQPKSLLVYYHALRPFFEFYW